jgi:hypothetical protein
LSIAYTYSTPIENVFYETMFVKLVSQMMGILPNTSERPDQGKTIEK